MKKLLLSASLFCLALFSVFAGDADEVKKTILNSLEYASDLKFDQWLSLYSRDYTGTGSNGEKLDFNTIKDIQIVMNAIKQNQFDTVALEKMFEQMMIHENRGKALLPEQRKMIQNVVAEINKKPEELKRIKQSSQDFLKTFRKEMEHQRRTFKFISVKVKGKNAVVVCEYETRLSSTEPYYQETATVKLKKSEKKWLIYNQTDKKK